MGLRIHSKTVEEAAVKLSYAMPYLNEYERNERKEVILAKLKGMMNKLSREWDYTNKD